MNIMLKAVYTATILSTWLVGNVARAQVKELIQYVPETANAVVVVDATAMFSSPIAKSEKWQNYRQKHFEAGMTSIPPLATALVIAADLDVDVMRASWEVAVAKMETAKPIAEYAKQLAGSVDQFGSVPAVRLPDDSFVLELADGVLGTMAPANRQKVSYWVTRSNRTLSPYLTQAIGDLGSKAQIVMVLDLNGAFSSDDIKRGIEKFASVQNSKVNKADLAKLMASIQGVTMEIAFRDKSYARLSLDFAEDPAMVSEIAKPLVLEMIGSYGVKLDEADDWKAEVKGKRVSLTGTITDHGLMRVYSLFHLPSHALHTSMHSSPGKASPGSASSGQTESTLELTQKYFASVQMLLKNLKTSKRNMQSMGQLAQYFDSYGRKVAYLPTLNVDPEMLQYGKYIRTHLRNCCFALKGIGIQEAVSENSASSSAKIYGGALGNISQDNWQSGDGYGGGAAGNYGRRVETNAAYGVARHFGVSGAVKSGMRQAQQARTTVQFQSQAQAASYVEKTQSDIETANDQIRDSMTQKYQVQF
jgi:hypothetical protein